MKHLFLLFLLVSQISILKAQTKKRISLEINYGINGNFFVRSYDETAPPPVKRFLKKDFIGSAGGFEVKYNLTYNSSINLAYAKSVNKREINYENGINAAILYFNIRHTNHFYQLFYETTLSKKIKYLKLHGGVYYLGMSQQEVDASPGGVSFEERDFKHYKLEEGGAFFGVYFSKKIDTKFDLGIKSRVYYTISTASFEAITLTPTLTYHF
ncbi:MAG: hypothetical protein K2Q24_08725 [Chitinophagaceae bacterium]|jgi:hypothetical protein|nr:hypothetical protein [Chitinophagaceae bacterium]